MEAQDNKEFQMNQRKRGKITVLASCLAIFWPGAFIFSFPGVMAPHWQQLLGVNRAATGRTLFFVLAAVGVFMFITGRWQEKIGPSKLTAFGALLGGGSTILVGYADAIIWVYLWAFLVGISSSLIYIPTLTVVQRWYPTQRGLVSGWVNLAFGLSAAIMSPVFTGLLGLLSYRDMTFWVGLVAIVVGLTASSYVRFPVSPAPPQPDKITEKPAGRPSFTLYEALATRSFWLIWGTWALAGAAGITMVTLSTSYGLSKGLKLSDAVGLLMAFNLTNGASRLLSGYLSDIIGRNRMMSVSFLGAAGAYGLLPYLEGLLGWSVLAAVVGFAFGTLFAVSAPLMVDCFGITHFGKIFGLVFTAYGFLAGALGPWLSGYILDISGGRFETVFFYLGSFFLISSILIWKATPPLGRS